MAKRLSLLFMMLLTLVIALPAEAAARRAKHGSGVRSAQKAAKSSSRKTAKTSPKKFAKATPRRTAKSKSSRIAKSRRGKLKYAATRSRHGKISRASGRSRQVVVRAKAPRRLANNGGSRYLWSAPWFDKSPYPVAKSTLIRKSFAQGTSSEYSPQQLVKAGVFEFQPLVGGIFHRRTAVKNIILHSTETASPADAKRVILSWNNRGRSHPGAQYIVDRSGVIYQTVDPKYGTVHVNVNRTKFGVTNDNSIGVEIVRSGKQKYTRPQMDSVACLVTYLQGRYDIGRSRVLAHGYVQPSTRTDPVNFNWTAFNRDLAYLSTGQPIASNDSPVTPVNAAAASFNPVSLPEGRFAMMFNGSTMKVNPFTFKTGKQINKANQARSKGGSVKISQASTYAHVINSDG